MKKLFALLAVVCLMLSCFSGMAAAEQETPRWNGFRGLDWGASLEDVKASLEKEGAEYWSDGKAVQDGIEYVFLNYTGVSVSGFDPQEVLVAYLLADDHLFLTGYNIMNSQDPEADLNYLEAALSSLYGSPSGSAEMPLPPPIEDIGLSNIDFADFTSWEADGTVILSGNYQGFVLVFYYGYDYYMNLISRLQNPEINTSGL